MSEKKESAALIFAGDFFVSLKDPVTGIFGPYKKLEAEKFETSQPSETKEKISKGKSTYGQAFVSFNVPKPCEFSVTLSEVTREVFAMQLAGALEQLSTNVETITDTEVPVILGNYVETGYRFIDPEGFLVKEAAGTSGKEYRLGVDYLIDYETGLICALPDGEITTSVFLSGVTQAVKGTRIVGGRVYNHVMKMKLSGKNLVNNRPCILEAEQGTVSSQEAYDFLGAELASVPLKGRLEIPPGGDRPFQFDYID